MPNLETNTVAAGIEAHFSELEDPRIDRKKLHKLLDIMVIAICAAICGADTWEDVKYSGTPKKNGSERFLSYRMAFLHMILSIEYSIV